MNLYVAGIDAELLFRPCSSAPTVIPRTLAHAQHRGRTLSLSCLSLSPSSSLSLSLSLARARSLSLFLSFSLFLFLSSPPPSLFPFQSLSISLSLSLSLLVFGGDCITIQYDAQAALGSGTLRVLDSALPVIVLLLRQPFQPHPAARPDHSS